LTKSSEAGFLSIKPWAVRSH